MRFCRCVAGCLGIALALLTGCQTNSPDMGYRLIVHAAMVNSTGLLPAEEMPDLNIRAAIPAGWEMLDADTTVLYTHEQWRSRTHATGFGVAYIHMPLPMSAKTLVWFAKSKYHKMATAQHKPEAQLQNEWTDSLGREWFEGESDKYHVKGYVVTDGFSAWAVYGGYRLKSPPDSGDISLALRGMESIVPLPLEKDQVGAFAPDLISGRPLNEEHPQRQLRDIH